MWCVCLSVCVCVCVWPSPNVEPKPIDQSRSNSILRALLQLSPARPFHFRPTLNVKGSSHEKQEVEWQIWNFTNMIILFCCNFLNQQERPPRTYCYVICNLLLIEINHFRIRILDIKCEKVRAVCPYILFLFVLLLQLYQRLSELFFPRCSFRKVLWEHSSYSNNSGLDGRGL